MLDLFPHDILLLLSMSSAGTLIRASLVSVGMRDAVDVAARMRCKARTSSDSRWDRIAELPLPTLFKAELSQAIKLLPSRWRDMATFLHFRLTEEDVERSVLGDARREAGTPLLVVTEAGVEWLHDCSDELYEMYSEEEAPSPEQVGLRIHETIWLLSPDDLHADFGQPLLFDDGPLLYRSSGEPTPTHKHTCLGMRAPWFMATLRFFDTVELLQWRSVRAGAAPIGIRFS